MIVGGDFVNSKKKAKFANAFQMPYNLTDRNNPINT